MSSERERDRRSLQDLAKLASTTTPAPGSVRVDAFGTGPLSAPASSRKDEDSGLVNLMAFAAAPPSSAAPASAPPASAGPASVAALASATAVASAPASVRGSTPSLADGPVSASAPSSIAPAVMSASVPSVDAPLSGPSVASVPVPAAVAATSVPAKKDNNGKIIAIGGLFAAAAIAAGAFFMTKNKPVDSTTAMSTPPPVAVPAAPVKAPEAVAVQAPTDDKPADPSVAATPKAPVAKAIAGGVVAKVEPKVVETKEEKKVEAKDLPPSAGAPGDLGAAMRQAAGPGAAAATDKPTGPQFAAGSVPQKPSQGAITGAIGSVLGGARQCVGEDDPISRATVTFASAGNVTSVSVSGGAAGKPAEACIKAALSKAHVAPFAEATYSAPVTIRH